MALPNLIIAGPPKAGTTSVFRYLTHHPDVCSSSIKEIHFFYRYRNDIDAQSIAHYESYFRRCASTNSIRLEASPRYLIGGGEIAELIRRYLPGVKLVFILREPVSRFFSRYVSLRAKTNRIPSRVPLDKLVDLALTHVNPIPNLQGPERQQEILEYLSEGSYARFLKEYLGFFSNKDMCILFFDELSKRPQEFMTKICSFAGIDPNFYNDYQFHVENKTRIVKHRRLHKFAERVTRRMEWLLNRYPALRGAVRKLYYKRINPEMHDKGHLITDYATQRLTTYYGSLNEELCLLLQREFPKLSLPAWLNNTVSPD